MFYKTNMIAFSVSRNDLSQVFKWLWSF